MVTGRALQRDTRIGTTNGDLVRSRTKRNKSKRGLRLKRPNWTRYYPLKAANFFNHWVIAIQAPVAESLRLPPGTERWEPCPVIPKSVDYARGRSDHRSQYAAMTAQCSLYL